MLRRLRVTLFFVHKHSLKENISCIEKSFNFNKFFFFYCQEHNYLGLGYKIIIYVQYNMCLNLVNTSQIIDYFVLFLICIEIYVLKLKSNAPHKEGFVLSDNKKNYWNWTTRRDVRVFPVSAENRMLNNCLTNTNNDFEDSGLQQKCW